MCWVSSFKYVVIISVQLVPLSPGEVSVGIGYIHTVDHILSISLSSLVVVLTVSMSIAWVGPSSPMATSNGPSDISYSIILGIHVSYGSFGLMGGQWENALNFS